MDRPAKSQTMLYVLACLLLLPSLPSSADQALDTAIDNVGNYTAVVFLVNGFTGCCVPGEKFQQFLRDKGAYVHISNWNEIDQKGHPGVPLKDGTWKVTPSPPNDETFNKQMREVIDKIDKKDPAKPIVLIGHSFGGDAVLQVAKRIEGRKIAFLAVLDGVGKGGLRKNITKPVPDNVDYFFNRWQQNPGIVGSTGADPMPEIHWIPLDRLLSGKIKSHAGESNQKKQNAEKTKKCKTKYRDPLKAIPNLLTHGGVPTDSCIQKKMKKILAAKVFH
ncbi:MAG: alpha/beta hydrolase [Nitrospiraceae bacterium]